MPDEYSLPALDPELVKALDKLIPERCPDPAWSDRKVWIEVGRREVVRLLQEHLRRQTEDSLIKEK